MYDLLIMSKQLEDYTFTNFKVYLPYKSIASSSSCSDREQSVKDENKDDGDDSWIRYQREDRGVQRNIARVKDARLLKKYVLRRFPLIVKKREEIFIEKSGRLEINTEQSLQNNYEKYYTVAKHSYNQRIKAFGKKLPKIAQTICQEQFSCPICLDGMVLPVVTSCGHSFCFQCIDQHTLFSINCPNCRSDIRDNDFHVDQPLNKLLLLIYSKREQQTQKKYKQRHNLALQWLKSRMASIHSLKIGDLLDIRDTQMIWCKGQIMEIYYSYNTQTNTNQITAILVHYQRWHNLYDEVIRLPTSRLTQYEYFTTREDISRYYLNSNLNNMQGMVERGLEREVDEVVESESEEQQQSQNQEQTVEVQEREYARGINLHRRIGPSRLIYEDLREQVSHHRNIFPYQIHFYYQFDEGNTRATYVLQNNGSNASNRMSRRNTEEDQESSVQNVENGNPNQEPV